MGSIDNLWWAVGRFVRRVWKPLTVVALAAILNSCEEKQFPNDGIPTPMDKDSTTHSTVDPASNEFGVGGGKSWEPSDRERILLEAGYNMHTD